MVIYVLSALSFFFSDDHFLPSDTPVGTVEERFVAIRTYLEGKL